MELVGCEGSDWFALAGGGRSQQGECSGARGAGFGVVDDERLAVGVRDRKLLVAQLERSDLRMVEQAYPAALGPDVVPGPQLTETFATNGQLAHQLVQTRIVDIGADERS